MEAFRHYASYLQKINGLKVLCQIILAAKTPEEAGKSFNKEHATDLIMDKNFKI